MKNSNVSAKKQVLLDFYGLHLQTVIRLQGLKIIAGTKDSLS